GADQIKIVETYQRRWNVEVIHRDLKQDGIGRIYLRGLCKTELYLRLIVTGRVLLEISSIRSLHKYQSIPEKVEIRKRWIGFEYLEKLVKGSRRYGKQFLEALKQSLTNPYKSTRNSFMNYKIYIKIPLYN
ncbi:MAG: hypothetical protein ACP5MW_06210, partial [Thermoplasmata archaeon]